MMGRSRVRRLRAVQGKYNADDAGSNQSYGRMPLGANERASERASVASFSIGKIATWGAIARARPLRLLRDRFACSLASRFVADSISSQGQCNRSVYKWACADGWMNGWKRHGGARSRLPSMVGRWRGPNGQHACAVSCIMYNSSSFFCEVVCMYIYQGAVLR